MRDGESSQPNAERAAPAGSPVPSPCIGVCRLDAAGAACEGCLRTLEEIAGWSRMDDAAREQVWQAIARRAADARR
jgi:hypothetical protein